MQALAEELAMQDVVRVDFVLVAVEIVSVMLTVISMVIAVWTLQIYAVHPVLSNVDLVDLLL